MDIWIYSSEIYYHRAFLGVLPSGQTTGPAMMRMVTQFSGIQQHFEDPKFAEGTDSWTGRFPSIVRTLFDGSERMVCGKTDTPHSPIAITSNDAMPCAHDTALWSRVIYIRFAPQVGEIPDRHLYEDFTNAIQGANPNPNPNPP